MPPSSRPRSRSLRLARLLGSSPPRAVFSFSSRFRSRARSLVLVLFATPIRSSWGAAEARSTRVACMTSHTSLSAREIYSSAIYLNHVSYVLTPFKALLFNQRRRISRDPLPTRLFSHFYLLPPTERSLNYLAGFKFISLFHSEL